MYRADNEPVTFTRDVDAIIVPAGVNVKLRQGQQGYITLPDGSRYTTFGNPTGPTAYQTARTFRFTVGLRF